MAGPTTELLTLKNLWQCRRCGDLVLTDALAPEAFQIAQAHSVCGACGLGGYRHIGMLMPLQREDVLPPD